MTCEPGLCSCERGNTLGVMKQLHGSASAEVSLPIDRCFSLLADVEGYPSWHPELVRAVAVLDRDEHGLPTRAQTTLHVAHGPLARDLEFVCEVRRRAPALVELTRIPHGSADEEQLVVSWRLQAREGTHIELALDARLAVPRLVPLGSIGDTLAAGFLRAAIERLQEGQPVG